MVKQARCFIKGDVIGVGFRAWTAIQAKKFGVTGWVRNVYDSDHMFGASGEVEALLQGDEEILRRMIDRLKEGPPIAQVDNVEVQWEEPKETFDDFSIQK